MSIFSDFGFQKIQSHLKASRVQSLFNDVASRYDLMNDAMSFGLHRCWKDYYVKALPLKTNNHILDLAGGTGDIAKRIHQFYPHLNPIVTVCDLTPNMVTEGRDRFLNEGIISQQNWICGTGEGMPFMDESFDGVTMSFGLRNVTHIDNVLSEIHRVLKPGGWFHCLEFSHVESTLLKKAYDLYSFQIIPLIGEKIANDRDAYQYLVESIRKFPTQEALVTLFKDAGLTSVTFENLMQGVVAIHSGQKD